MSPAKRPEAWSPAGVASTCAIFLSIASIVFGAGAFWSAVSALRETVVKHDQLLRELGGSVSSLSGAIDSAKVQARENGDMLKAVLDRMERRAVR